MEKLNLYKINEVLEHKYYKVPKELFVNKLYKDKLNTDSKILYAFLIDRLTLSEKNNWYDEYGNIYLIFTREEVKEKLNLSDKTATKAFKQLTDTKLIFEKRQGQGKPNLIFVGKIQHYDINEYIDKNNLQNKNRNFYDSRTGNFTGQDSEILREINTDNINTYIIDDINSEKLITLEEIKSKCKLDEFNKEEKLVLKNVLNKLYYCDNLKVGNVNISNSKILSKLQLITKNNLTQLVDILNNGNNIKNITNYLMICLYNNLGKNNVNIKKRSIKEDTNRYKGREYTEEFLESFYDNI